MTDWENEPPWAALPAGTGPAGPRSPWCLARYAGMPCPFFTRCHDVLSFRDLSIPMQVRAVRKFGGKDWWLDAGGWTGRRAELVEKAWKNADEIVDMPSEEMPDKSMPSEDWNGAKRALSGGF